MLIFALLTVVNAADFLWLRNGHITINQEALADAVAEAPSAVAAAQIFDSFEHLWRRLCVTHPGTAPDSPSESTVASLDGRYRTEVQALLGSQTIQDPVAVVALIEGWQTLAAEHSVLSGDMAIGPHSEVVTALLARARQEAAN